MHGGIELHQKRLVRQIKCLLSMDRDGAQRDKQGELRPISWHWSPAGSKYELQIGDEKWRYKCSPLTERHEGVSVHLPSKLNNKANRLREEVSDWVIDKCACLHCPLAKNIVLTPGLVCGWKRPRFLFSKKLLRYNCAKVYNFFSS